MLQQVQNISNVPANEMITFIPHDLPGLQAGEYTLTLEQTIEGISGNALSSDYKLAVRSDRFRLSNPVKTIYSVFPPENTSGKYTTVLPSVVFNPSSFPWSRSPGGTSSTNGDIPTWLTVILLDEEDVKQYAEDFPGFSLEPQIRTIEELISPSSSGNTDYGYYSYFSSQQNLNGSLELGQQPTDNIQTIDIPVELFVNIAPSIEDLSYMAHVRKVSLVNKPTLSGISDTGEAEGSFSVVFGNRLPGSNRKTHAYLVSLENFLPLNLPDISKMVRLAVLKNWTFYATDEDSSFVDRIKQLNGAGLTEDKTTTLRLNDITKNPSEYVYRAFQMGFVPLNHHLRSGTKGENRFIPEKTVSWYRGPLSPCWVEPHRINPPFNSADQITLFDPTVCMFDVSYACAWTLGRQMALQDKDFSIKLFNWRNQMEINIQSDMEREYLQSRLMDVPEQTLPNKAFLTKQTLSVRKNSGSFKKQVLRSLQNKK